MVEAHESHVTKISCSPDGNKIASSGSDGKIKIW
jgi:WD40 repeat protein